MKIAVVGGVKSTEVVIQALVDHQIGHVAVWGYEPAETKLVSGWCDLRELANRLGIMFAGFRKVTECEVALRAFAPDILFVAGLSQIVPPSMLNIANLTSIGFHPTPLPRGRGRAALAWLILEREHGAATFFELRDGVDDGPIFVQEPYVVVDSDDAADVEAKLLLAERIALDSWLPRVAQGDLATQDQDHDAATWYGRRTPEDGWLNWMAGRDDLLRLIRASAPPHPGAFTFCQNHKILILKGIASDRRETGVPGRILTVNADGGFEVQAGRGIVRVTDWQSGTGWTPRIGALLGYYAEAEIFDLRARLAQLEAKLVGLQSMVGDDAS